MLRWRNSGQWHASAPGPICTSGKFQFEPSAVGRVSALRLIAPLLLFSRPSSRCPLARRPFFYRCSETLTYFSARQVRLRTRPRRPSPTRYLDRYIGPGPVREVEDALEDMNMDGSLGNGAPRSRGPYNGGQQYPRKRRFRGPLLGQNRTVLISTDNDFDDRPARRHRYEEPIASRLRREIVLIAQAVRPPTDPAALTRPARQ